MIVTAKNQINLVNVFGKPDKKKLIIKKIFHFISFLASERNKLSGMYLLMFCFNIYKEEK